METRDPLVLVVDDEPGLQVSLSALLKGHGLNASAVGTGTEAYQFVREHGVALVLLDLRLEEEDGLDVLQEIKQIRPETSVILITGLGSIPQAVEAMRLGADFFVEKTMAPAQLLTVVDKGLDAWRLRRQNLVFHSTEKKPDPLVFATHGAMAQAVLMADAVSGRNTSVLLFGETGVGKGLMARRVHQKSDRQDKPFVVLNCALLKHDLMESELFGHEKGAFTGAEKRKAGLVEVAEGGTLFLDEIGELPLPTQAKLLHLLEDGFFRRLGGLSDLRADIRIIAATNRNLHQQVQQGAFREDLYYRLNVFSINIPPLRDRPEDIPLLIRHSLASFYPPQSRIPLISSQAMALLKSYLWPGNVRELRNILERATILCGHGAEIKVSHLPVLSPGDGSGGKSSSPIESPQVQDDTLAGLEAHQIKMVLSKHTWNIKKAAEVLGMSRSTLYRKMKNLGLSRTTP